MRLEPGIIRSKHRARKEYECCECKAKITVGSIYVLHQEQVNWSYWHKTKYCTKCMTADAVNLKQTQNVRPNRPCAGEWWVVRLGDSKENEVIQLADDYYKEKTYYEMGGDVMMVNKEDGGYNHQPVTFIRKVYVDD